MSWRVEGHGLVSRRKGGVFPAECFCGLKSRGDLPNRARRDAWQRAHVQSLKQGRHLERVSAAKMAKDAQITYRQLDHWTRAGYLQVQSQGSGVHRFWDGDERFVAIEMGKLVRAGFTAEAAAVLARRHVEEPSVRDEYEIEVGVVLRFAA